MRPLAKRIIGIALILAAASGLLFSIGGLISIWALKPAVTNSLLSNVQTISVALETTSEGLTIASDSLETSIDSVTAMQYTIEATAETIDATTPMVETMATLAREDLPATVATVQTSLLAAQESAKIIDSVLTALTSIPFVSKDIYNPPVPLHVALEQVSASLEPLPAALSTIDQSLESANDSLKSIQNDITLMAADVNAINSSLDDAQGVVDDYQKLIADMQARTDWVEEQLPSWITLLVLLFSYIFLWLGVAQIGLLLQGWELLQVRNEQQADA